MEDVERECPSPDILKSGEEISEALMSHKDCVEDEIHDTSRNLEERLKAVEALAIDSEEEDDENTERLDFVPETDTENDEKQGTAQEEGDSLSDDNSDSFNVVPETDEEEEGSEDENDKELEDAFEATRSDVLSPISVTEEPNPKGKTKEIPQKKRSPKRKFGKCPRRSPAKKQRTRDFESPELFTEEQINDQGYFYKHPESKLIFETKEQSGVFHLCHTGKKIEKEELFQFQDCEEIEKNIKNGTIINFNMKKRIKKDIYMVTYKGVAIVTQYADGGAIGGHAIAKGSRDFWNVQKSSGENKYYDDVRVRLVTSTTWLKLEKYQIEDESYGILLTPEMDPSLKIKLIESVNKDEGIYWSEKDQENIVYFSHWDKAPISEICWRVICKLEGEKDFYSNRRYFEEIEDPLNFLDRYIPVTKN
tara:strand:+ start:3170 stop:4432 length:1263 start_codon:yes stop_codon:yes gene_type:complete